LLFTISGFTQTTGKISGVVGEKETGSPVLGANVYLEGTTIGAATDEDGFFSILNVPPGSYTLTIQMIGYKKYQIEDLRISVNRTAYIKAEIETEIIVGETVIVQAEKIAIKKDQTSSIRNINADQIKALPVEDLESVVNLQAGVINGHFRGGRKNEVAYLVDGLQVMDAFSGESSMLTLEAESVEDLEVITGTFNAEYGRAMSGIVNAVTKTGTNEFHGFAQGHMANYVTHNDDIFLGLDPGDLDRQTDLKMQLSGPIIKDKITFFLNFRNQDINEFLNGIYRFTPDDYSNFSSYDPNAWISSHNGDDSYVALNYSKLTSFLGKITTYPFKTLRFSLLYSRNDQEWRDYNHSFKYNPDGLASNHSETDMLTLSFNHMLSQNMFYDAKFSYINNYYGWYVFEDPLDSRYVHNSYLNNIGTGFFTGGQQKGHTRQTTEGFNAKFDLIWQANKTHLIKSGFLFTQHHLTNEWYEIQNAYDAREEDQDFSYFDSELQKRVYPYYEPIIYGNGSIYADVYTVKPYEFSLYIQDKMEFDEMVLNLGIRYDYFQPNSYFATQPRNPANQLSFPDSPEKMSDYQMAEPQSKISPRLGLSYQLGNRAVLHFSYGHFFQMPPMYALYQNRSQIVAPTDYQTTMGNTQLEAQKTIQYELGLWQELARGLGFEVVVYYRDIYDLLSTKIITTYNQINYGLYTNKDYGNVKGLEIKLDYTSDSFSTYLNYTLQYTRGNSDNPTQTFNREGESRDPIPTLIPMSWDQRHTLNLTIGYNTPDYGITAVGYYFSGTPYTWTPVSENRVANINLYPNNSYQPTNGGVDLRGYVDIYKWNDVRVRLLMSVYNLFDQLNDNWVDSTTGRAYTSIVRESDVSSHRSDFNTYADTYQDPSLFNRPRLIKLGLGIGF